MRFWTTGELRALGVSRSELRRRRESGRLVPLRTGWFVEPGADADVVRAVRVGGLATAHTAARALGLWAPPDEKVSAFRRKPASCVLHVAVASTTALAKLHDPDSGRTPLSSRPDVVLHWTSAEALRRRSGQGAVEPILVLEHLFRCETPERALAVLDSALHLRLLDRRDLAELAGRLPAPLRPVVFAADERAESGTETIVRFKLRAAGLTVVVQPRIDGTGRVDLLVEGRLIVECDGREWHDDEDAFERDRGRDAASARNRYRTLRFSWFQVLFQWPVVEAAVFAALGR